MYFSKIKCIEIFYGVNYAFYSHADKNYIRINVIVHSSDFNILHDEKIAVVYATFWTTVSSSWFVNITGMIL